MLSNDYIATEIFGCLVLSVYCTHLRLHKFDHDFF